jgi:hypothetical protein
MSGSAECRNHPPRGKRAQRQLLIGLTTRSPERVQETRAFLLTMTYMEAGDTATTPGRTLAGHRRLEGRFPVSMGSSPQTERMKTPSIGILESSRSRLGEVRGGSEHFEVGRFHRHIDRADIVGRCGWGGIPGD